MKTITEIWEAWRVGRVSRRDLDTALATLGLSMVVLPLTRHPARASVNLTYLTWAGYELDELNPAFIEKYGGPPEVSFFADQEEAIQKVRAGYNADIIHPCSETVLRWRLSGYLRPIDPGRLATWDDVWPSLKELKGTVDEDGNIYFVPMDWGNASVLYRPDLVEIEEESWALLFDERYQGRLSMYDEASAAVQVAAAVLGYDNLFTLSDEQLVEVKKLLEKQRELMRYYWSSNTDIEQGLATGELVAAYAWNTSLLELQKQGIPAAYANPKEGIRTWVCGFVWSTSGTGDEQQVYDFMDARLAPEVGKWLLENYGYGHANMRTLDLVEPETLAELGMSDPKAMLEDSVFLEGEEPPYDENYIRVFEEVKAGF